MRLFVAVDLPGEVKDELYRIQKLINPSLAKIKWVPKKNLHLTLKFLGECPDTREVEEKLSKIKFDPFKVKLNNFGAFPSWNEIKVFWVSLTPEKKITALQQKIDSELFSLFKKDQQFSPHLTLGRIKRIKKKKQFFELISKEIEVKPIEFKINEFKLMQSKLTKDGSKYLILKNYKA